MRTLFTCDYGVGVHSYYLLIAILSIPSKILGGKRCFNSGKGEVFNQWVCVRSHVCVAKISGHSPSYRPHSPAGFLS